MSYFPKRRALAGLGAFGCESFDINGVCIDPLPDPGVNIPSDSQPIETSSTSQDTTVLPSGSTVGGQATGTPTAATGLWKTLAGVCYATTTDFLGTLKELQRQCNRVASVKGWSLIGIDGQVGPQTLALMGKIAGLGAYSSIANPSIMTCDQVCSNVYAFIAATSSFADGIGASSSVSSPSAATQPVVYDPKVGKLVGQPVTASIADAFENLSSTEKLLAAGAALGLVYFLRKSGGKSKSKGRR